MRWIRSVSVVLFAVLALSATAAASASAFHPLFLTQSGKALLFTGETGPLLLRGLMLGALDIGISCEKSLLHGWVLNKSTLAEKIKLVLHGKCQEIINGTAESCKEPLEFKELLGELGLINSTNDKVVLLLAPSSGTELIQYECGGHINVLKGAVIGEFPEISKKGINQYNKQLGEAELVFESENDNENQKIKEIFLLGVQMTGVAFTFGEGFLFSGPASLEAAYDLKPDGWIEISTH